MTDPIDSVLLDVLSGIPGGWATTEMVASEAARLAHDPVLKRVPAAIRGHLDRLVREGKVEHKPNIDRSRPGTFLYHKRSHLETVWGRPVFASAEEEIRVVAHQIESTTTAIHNYVNTLKALNATLDALIQAAEERRLGRVSDIKVGPMMFDEQRITATIQGTTGKYQTRIRVSPRRGHHCTCPDWAKNGIRVGPCKHVLALGMAFREHRLLPALDRILTTLMGILDHSEV